MVSHLGKALTIRGPTFPTGVLGPCVSRSPSSSLDSPGSAARTVLLTVASSSERFDFHAAAFDPLATFANPQAKTFENKHDAKKGVVGFIVSDKEGLQTIDDGLPESRKQMIWKTTGPFS